MRAPFPFTAGRLLQKGCRLVAASLAAAALAVQAGTSAPSEPSSPPKSPRELYNAGTAELKQGRLREAQELLRAAAESNEDSIMPDALFNLGHTRYRLGEQEFKRLMERQQTLGDLPRRANRSAEAAMMAAQQALASGDVDEMVRAYRRGQGARRELRAAREAVRQALEHLGSVLVAWQRASADFHSAHELQPRRDDAAFNADIVDQRIAALIDMIRQQQQMLSMPSPTSGQLGEAMRQMRGRVPQDKRDQMGAGDEEDDEGESSGDRQNDTSAGAGTRGADPTSQQQAEQLLRSMQLDSNKVLPPGRSPAGQPARRPGGDW